MKRYSVVIAAVLTIVGLVPAGAAWAACDVLDPAGFPGLFSPVMVAGVVRIAADNPVPPSGSVLSDWTESSTTIRCSTAGRYVVQGVSSQPPIDVITDGTRYAAIDFGNVGLIGETIVGGQVIPISQVSGAGMDIGNVDLPAGDTSFTLRYRVVGLGLRFEEGQIGINPDTAPQVYFDRSSNFGGYPLSLDGTIIRQLVTCTPAGIDQTVNIGRFLIADAPGAGGAWPLEKDFGFTLSCPATVAGIVVYAVFTDAINPGNGTDQLTLGGADVPAGVAIKLFQDNGIPITFRSETVEPGTWRYELLQSPAEGIADHPVSFKAQLYQTLPDVGEGEIHAAVLVTLIYN